MKKIYWILMICLLLFGMFCFALVIIKDRIIFQIIGGILGVLSYWTAGEICYKLGKMSEND